MTINYQSQRRLKNFQVRKVREALPEIFTTDHPKFVSFLENYYNFMDSDNGTHAFGDDIRRIFATKDIGETPEALLNNMVSELAGGLETGENFTDTRYALTRLAELARNKGTKFSFQEFFRLFFQEVADVEYGKESIFTIGEPSSQIGTESLKYIQNNRLFQVFGLLIKTSLDTSKWQELYKKFVHPAGFYFEGQVTTDTEAAFALSAPLSIVDSDPGPTILSQASVPLARSFTQLTALIDSSGGGDVRSNLDEKISDYQSYSLTQLDTTYHKVSQIITPNAFTFDDTGTKDSDLAASPDFSVTLETMDNQIFTRYTSDSTI